MEAAGLTRPVGAAAAALAALRSFFESGESVGASWPGTGWVVASPRLRLVPVVVAKKA